MKRSIKERILLFIIPLLVSTLQRIYGFTLKRIDINKEPFLQLKKENKNYIYSIWHTNVFFSPYLNRNQNVNVMISDSRDGEMIARVVRYFRNRSIRGSTSKNGIRALKTLVKELKAGRPAAITPDGPRGPAFQIQPGIIQSAMMSGAAIVPFHYEATRQWIAEKAWDKHRIPKPFSHLIVRYGDPIFVPASLDADQFDFFMKEVQHAMLENMRMCQEKVNEMK